MSAPRVADTVLVRSPGGLGRDEIARIAFDGHRLELLPDALAEVSRGRAAATVALAGDARVYGVTTGQGYLAGRDLSEPEIRLHQRNLLMGRAVGSAPWLPREEARALVAVRLARFLGGRSGVGPGLCAYLADRLNDDFVPAVPRTAVGCSGEVIPLSHAFQTLVGVGRVIEPDGELRDARAALSARGAPPYELGPKEGIALLAGSPGTTALALSRLRDGERLARLLLAGAACAIDAANAPLDAYDPAVGRVANDPLLADLLERLGRLLAGSHPDRPASQSPVSFRVAPQVLAHLERTLARLAEDLERGLGGSDDSPALVDGRFLSTGAFHEVELAAGMDALAAALSRAADLAVQRVHRLLDHRFTGLPDQLTPVPGPRCGLVVLHKRAAGAAAELRRLAVPASIGAIDTSLGQEDAQTFGFAAGEMLRRAQELALEVLAIELLTCRQAWALRGRPPPDGLHWLAEPLMHAVEPVDEDRPLGEDVDRVAMVIDGLP
jgi:histidine ammonia-lyase